MSIRIDVELEARPRSIRLPAAISLCQTLHSSSGSPRVTLVYALSPGNDVCFRVGNSEQKTVSFEETIGTIPRERCHEVQLVRCAGTRVTSCRIRQTLRAGADPASGIGPEEEEFDTCRVTILS